MTAASRFFDATSNEKNAFFLMRLRMRYRDVARKNAWGAIKCVLRCVIIIAFAQTTFRYFNYF